MSSDEFPPDLDDFTEAAKNLRPQKEEKNSNDY